MGTESTKRQPWSFAEIVLYGLAALLFPLLILAQAGFRFETWTYGNSTIAAGDKPVYQQVWQAALPHYNGAVGAKRWRIWVAKSPDVLGTDGDTSILKVEISPTGREGSWLYLDSIIFALDSASEYRMRTGVRDTTFQLDLLAIGSFPIDTTALMLATAGQARITLRRRFEVQTGTGDAGEVGTHYTKYTWGLVPVW